MKLLLLLVLVAGDLCVAMKSYKGYKVYRTTPKDELSGLITAEFANQFMAIIDIWAHSRGVNDHMDFMVAPDMQENVETVMKRREIKFDILVEDVQNKLDETKITGDSTYDVGALATFNYDTYHTNDEIDSWMNDMVVADPTLVSLQRNIGTTIEGREIRALKIGKQDPGKKAIWFQGGIHAREWISPATMINVARYLVDEYRSNDDQVVNFLDTFDVFIIPVLNQDGYEFTWTNDRMWRKNRNKQHSTLQACYGVDLNRNYDYKFGGDGASALPCSEVFHGSYALSEPETSSTAAFLKAHQQSNGVSMFIDFHSYGQFWMWPWGYATGLENTPDHDQLEGLCLEAKQAIYGVNGLDYTCQISALMYAAAGATEDFGYGSLGTKYSFIVELPPGDGSYGFILPESYIKPTGMETYAGIKTAIQYIIDNP